jgi:hypothetical protein
MVEPHFALKYISRSKSTINRANPIPGYHPIKIHKRSNKMIVGDSQKGLFWHRWRTEMENQIMKKRRNI